MATSTDVALGTSWKWTVRVDWHPRPHGAPTSTTSSTLNGHLLRQTRCTFIPHFTDDKWNAHGFPKVTQIWGSWTTALGGCHLEFPTVDGRVLSPCWPHEYAELVFWESWQLSNNKPVLQLYLNLICKGPWQIFSLGLVWALSNQVLKPVGGHHNQLLNPNCLAALGRPKLRITRLCHLRTALGNPHPAVVNSSWVQGWCKISSTQRACKAVRKKVRWPSPGWPLGRQCVCVCVCVCVC